MPTYYKRNTNPTNNNWNQADNWSTVSSTSATNTGTFPSSTTADPVIFDANSIQVTIATGVPATCTSINFTGYANTITMDAGLTVHGSVTLSPIMGILGTGGLTILATSTLTSGGKTWPNTLTFGSGGAAGFVATFADDWRIKNLTTGGNSARLLNKTIYVEGDVTSNGLIGGDTTDIVFDGTGDQTLTSTTVSGYAFETSITINKPSGKFTLGTTFVWRPKSGKTFKYITAGSYSTTGSTLYIYGGGTAGGVLDISLINLNNIRFNDSGATINMTLGSDVNVDGNVVSTGNGINLTGAYKINVKGDFTQSSGPFTNSNVSAGVVFTGSNNQTFGHAVGSSFPLATNLEINKSGGTLKLGSTTNQTMHYGTATATLTYTSGAMDPQSTTFVVVAGTTYNINSSGFSLNNWTPLTGTHTINSINSNIITVNGNLTLSTAGNTTFAGNTGWSAANINDTTPLSTARTVFLKDGVTYTIRSIFNLTGANATRWTISSSDATNRAILTLNYGAAQSLVYVNGTRIDSSLGQTVWTFGGTLLTTSNWNNGTRPPSSVSLKMG